MGRYLLKIAFDGTHYHGWQVQNNAITVQQIMCENLSNMHKSPTEISGCSRTDAGVHAKEFYCHFDSDLNISCQAYIKGLNSTLPNDIAVLDCVAVPDDFHARYSAKAKNYLYNFYDGNIKDPFLTRYSYSVPMKLDENRINAFCEQMIGTYDFIGFSSSKRTVENTVRTISACSAVRNGDLVTLSVTADGFLYNMVRIIAGTALYVATGKINPENTKNIILSKSRKNAGPTIPAKGLFLNKVIY